jgi:nicotinamidase-related amidase
MEPLNRPAVIVADMLVDFITGALANPPSQEIIAPLATLLAGARSRGWPVCYVNDAHLPGDAEERLWGAHATATCSSQSAGIRAFTRPALTCTSGSMASTPSS